MQICQYSILSFRSSLSKHLIHLITGQLCNKSARWMYYVLVLLKILPDVVKVLLHFQVDKKNETGLSLFCLMTEFMR